MLRLFGGMNISKCGILEPGPGPKKWVTRLHFKFYGLSVECLNMESRTEI